MANQWFLLGLATCSCTQMSSTTYACTLHAPQCVIIITLHYYVHCTCTCAVQLCCRARKIIGFSVNLQTPDVPHSLTSSLAADDTHSISSDHGSHLALPPGGHVPPASPSASGGMGPSKVGQVQFTHILQKDCFLVFRSLCKLSMKGISDIHDSKLVTHFICLREVL